LVFSAFSYGDPFVAQFYGYIAQYAVWSNKVHYYFPSPFDQALEKLFEGFWIRRVGVQNVLEDDKLDVGFWNVRLIQVAAGFHPKAKMVTPENVNQIVIEAFQLPLIKAFIGNLSFGFHGDTKQNAFREFNKFIIYNPA
jgi:hypothetical protein